MDAGLGGGIVDLTILPGLSVDRPDIDDPAQPRSRMPGNVALAMLKQPPRLMRITSFQSSNDILWSTPSRVTPALFTTISIGPTSWAIRAQFSIVAS